MPNYGITIIVGVFLLVGGMTNQENRPQSPTNIERPSSFIISTLRDTYLVYEPIQITFTLTNDRDEEIVGDFGLDFNCNQIAISYRREGQEFYHYASERTETPREMMYVTKIPIPAHGQLSGSEILLYDIRAHRFVFSEPGVYEFQATYSYSLAQPGSQMKSNLLRVTVLPLPAEESRQAFSLWKDPYLARLIQGDSVSPLGDEVPLEERKAGVQARLAELVEKYPDSVYTQAAKEILVRRYEKKREYLLTEFQKEVLRLFKRVP